jgi:formate dehydrogenase maturation protein FdhE
MAADDANPWSTHRRRAEQLRGRYPFAAEVLGLYAGLLDAWHDTWLLATEERPGPTELADWSVRQALPRVVKVTEAAGPPALAAAVRELPADDVREACVAWLAGSELDPVAAYVVRACLRPALDALDDADVAAAFTRDPLGQGGSRCPRCGGLPQLSTRAGGDEKLVSGGRSLTCARCWHTWPFSASTCPSCGETTGAKRTLYAEHHDGPVVEAQPDPGAEPVHPHIRIEACASCQRYLLDIGLGRDPAAVPEVDELAAVPLALYAADQGLTKITPNLVGF